MSTPTAPVSAIFHYSKGRRQIPSRETWLSLDPSSDLLRKFAGVAGEVVSQIRQNQERHRGLVAVALFQAGVSRAVFFSHDKQLKRPRFIVWREELSASILRPTFLSDGPAGMAERIARDLDKHDRNCAVLVCPLGLKFDTRREVQDHLEAGGARIGLPRAGDFIMGSKPGIFFSPGPHPPPLAGRRPPNPPRGP